MWDKRDAVNPGLAVEVAVTVEEVQEWLELELARLRLELEGLVADYFREARERSFSLRVWPRLKSHNGISYVVWCRKDYINPGRKIVRTQHIARGQGSYRGRLGQACRYLPPEERGFVLSYEERFQMLRQQLEVLVRIRSGVVRYIALRGKEKEKALIPGPEVADIC